MKQPLYVLPHGIKVISEYRRKTYVYCLVRPHRLLYNRTLVARSRVVMTSVLGRRLKSSEHVHHGKKGRFNDTPKNLELLTARKHNQHHKRGTKHTTAARHKISESLARAYATGRRERPDLYGRKNPFFGKTHTKAARKKMSKSRRAT